MLTTSLDYNKVVPLFWLRKAKKRKKDGKSPIYLRLTINEVRANDGNSTGIYVYDEDFCRDRYIILETDPNYERLNNHLKILKGEIYTAFLWLEKWQRRVTPQEFMHIFRTKAYTQIQMPLPTPQILVQNSITLISHPTLSEICERFLKDCPLTPTQYKISKYHLKNLCEVAPTNKFACDYKRSDFDKLAKDYLEKKPKRKEKHKNQRENYLKSCFSSLKRVFKWCAEEEILPKNNFAYTPISKKFPAPTFLNLEEIEKIRTFDFSMCEIENEKGEKEKIKPKEVKKMNEMRTYFLFCIYTGLYPSDYLNLVNKNGLKISMVQNEQGENLLWLKGQRQKGRGKKNYGDFEMPIMGEAKKIWEATNGNLPLIDIANYDFYLSKMSKYLGFTFKITSKLARTTFVWLCMNIWDVPDLTIARMIGHSSTNILKTYARVFDQKIMRDTAHVNEDYIKNFVRGAKTPIKQIPQYC